MKFTVSTFIVILIFGFLNIGFAQQVVVEGYAYEEHNRGFLREVKITALKLPIRSLVATDIFSDATGKFVLTLPAGETYLIRGEKDIFKTIETEISTVVEKPGQKVYTKLEMQRKPGYLFEATLAEKRTNPDQQVDAIQGSLIEIYNNTTDKEELVLENHPDPAFSYTFEQGNHYTIMVRKEGYLAKRIEAYVNINGCIVCIDGVKQAGPGVTDVLTHGFEMGTLLANIEMDRADLNTKIAVDNIYYDLDKWDIRPEAAEELDKVVVLMNDNPDIIVELGSHTDSRGGDKYNLDLSDKRASAAVSYITSVGGISTERIKSKGYGETQLVNRCKNGVKCSERRHQQNRRTELKIIGFKPQKMAWKSLRMIVAEEKFLDNVGSFGSGVVKIGEDGTAIQETTGGLVSIDRVVDVSKIDTYKKTTQPAEREINTTIETAPVVANQTIPQPSTQVTTEVVTTPVQPQVTESEKIEKVITMLDEADLIESEPAYAYEEVEMTSKGSTGIQSTGQTQVGGATYGETQIVEEANIPSNNSNFKYEHFLLAQDYNGIMVEAINSFTELTAEHPIFSDFGSVTIEKRPDGSFSYLLGNFNNDRIAVYFMNNAVIDKYPTARLVNFTNGQRK